jgi:hypothetical protein
MIKMAILISKGTSSLSILLLSAIPPLIKAFEQMLCVGSSGLMIKDTVDLCPPNEVFYWSISNKGKLLASAGTL